MQYMLIHAGAPDLDDAWNDEAWARLDVDLASSTAEIEYSNTGISHLIRIGG